MSTKDLQYITLQTAHIWNGWWSVSQSYTPPILHCIHIRAYLHTHTHAFLSTHTWICPRVDSFWQRMSLISFWECLSIIAFPKITRHHSHQGAFQSVTICHFRCGTSTTRNQSIELFGTPVPCCGLIVGATLKYVPHSPILVSPHPHTKQSPFHTQDGYLHGPHHREQTSSFKSSHANVWHLIQTLHGEKDTQQ